MGGRNDDNDGVGRPFQSWMDAGHCKGLTLWRNKNASACAPLSGKKGGAKVTRILSSFGGVGVVSLISLEKQRIVFQ
jgi:hypothetical protein